MPLPLTLRDEVLCYPCPLCAYELCRSARWFRTQSQFTCAGCRTRVQVTYAAKLKLFADYERKHPPA